MEDFSIQELFEKPMSYKFSDSEIEYLKKRAEKKNGSELLVKYAFYKPESSKGLYIAFIYDTMANASRRSGVENKWELFATRKYTEMELLEYAQNWGSQLRRFKVYYYKYIECLKFDDIKYNIQTPEAFIQEAIKRGYTNPNFDLIKWEMSFKKNLQFTNEPKQLILF